VSALRAHFSQGREKCAINWPTAAPERVAHLLCKSFLFDRTRSLVEGLDARLDHVKGTLPE